MLRRLWNWLVGSKNESIRSELLKAVDVGRIQRLDLVTGDIVVLAVPRPLSRVQIERLKQEWNEIASKCRCENVGLWILDEGVRFETVLGGTLPVGSYDLKA